ncbi:MAG: tetratricopeptide repeat protein [Chthoniobacterales bacterium]
MNLQQFLTELKRRKVYSVAVAYAVVSWLLIQIVTQTFPFFEIPNWAIRWVLLILIVGFPLALVLSWAFELTPEGIKPTGSKADGKPVTRRTGRKFVAVIAILASLAVGMSLFRAARPKPTPPVVDSPLAVATIPAKSIAVLPFQSLSANPENAFFADGVQDEILTDLARVADLKVISRTSVMQYKGEGARNVRAIGQALGVAHLLEGTVQRSGSKVRVNAQLIDARTDAHLWAHSYDRDVSDLLAIQSEIAETIADQLRAKLSPEVKAENDRQPTTDLDAFGLYTQARKIVWSASAESAQEGDWRRAISLLEQAVARDPNFFLAYCQLAAAHGQLYFFGYDHTPARCSLFGSAVDSAARLRPDAGETHLVRAEYLYRCHLDYSGALAELETATALLPNSSEALALTAAVARRQGHWEESIRHYERALQLDPRNVGLLQQSGVTYDFLRRYADEAGAFDRALELAPGNAEMPIIRGFVEVQWRGDLRKYHEAIHAFLSKNPQSAEDIATDWFQLALFERDPAEARLALASVSKDGGGSNAMVFRHAWFEALAARVRGDDDAAREALTQARAEQELAVHKQPDFGPPLAILGLIDAGLGREEDAMREGRRAIELLPMAKDSVNGSMLMTNLAAIYTWCGEKDLAIQQLKRILSKPGDGSYGDFRLNPLWDPLRGDPRFEQIVTSLAPKA